MLSGSCKSKINCILVSVFKGGPTGIAGGMLELVCGVSSTAASNDTPLLKVLPIGRFPHTLRRCIFLFFFPCLG